MYEEDNNVFPDRRKFLLKNLVRGLIWLLVIVGGYVYARNNSNFTLESVLGEVYEKPIVVYLLFLGSEVIFGVIPPEFFMIWSLRSEVLSDYVSNIILLSVISYMAGVIGFFVGQYLNNTRFYKETKKRVFGKFAGHLNNYGGFLVVVAALTPLPFSGISMLVGSMKYPLKKYLYFSLFRFVRFLVYSIIIWEVNVFN